MVYITIENKHIQKRGEYKNMMIIGEKINGSRSRVAQAIAGRDREFIIDLAKGQVANGVDFLDVNAGTSPERETEDLVWLVRTVQEAVDVPLCLDSPNPQPLSSALKQVKKMPIINSISGESVRLNNILPLVAEYGCPVIALALDDSGIPKTTEDRLEIVRRVLHQTRAKGIPDEKVYIDPLVLTLGTDSKSGKIAMETMQRIRSEFPKAHLIVGLSNISFGLPARHLINRIFLSLAMMAGLDSAILDPTDQVLRTTILTTELVLGEDRFCRNFTQSYRSGLIVTK
jgi:5-methyltetrahydrofolate--homocysteine methyltransferase